jgi:hypothetical protein
MFQRVMGDHVDLTYPRILYSTMDQFDTLARNGKVARNLLTPRISNLITRLSIITKCLFQIELWKYTPDIASLIQEEEDEPKCGGASNNQHKEDTDDNEEDQEDNDLQDKDFQYFRRWVQEIETSIIPEELINHINPVRGKATLSNQQISKR